MFFSKTRSVLAVLAAANYAAAHTTFTNFYVNGVDQGPGVAVRMNHKASEASFPVENLASNDMACGFDGETGVSRVAPVPSGSTLTFEFHSWADDKTKEVIDRGHYGPCAVYLKKVASATDDPGYGDGWFKIWDEGYDGSTNQWCTDKLIDNKGLLSVGLPQALEGGYYLARPEILALHNASNGDPQFYMGCGQIFIENGGDLGPAETVSIPGYVKAGEQSVSWNIYYGTDPNKYPVPGPKVASLVSGASARIASQPKQAVGLKPQGCILENANFCAFEVPSYTDENGCWAASKDCWSQTKNCWNTAPATGGAGCKILETKCNNLDDSCNAKIFTGPPNKGKDLTPSYTTIALGNLLPTTNLGSAPAPSTPAASAPASSSPAVSAAAAVSTPAASPAPASPAAAESSPEAYTPNTPAPSSTPTSVVAAAPAPSSTEEADEESSPAPTPAPYGASGVNWVTVTEWVEVTEYEYVTVYDKYRRGHVVRRRAHRH